MDRCLKPTDFGEVITTQLHYFADASDQSYGIVTYIWFTNSNDRIQCQLLISKAYLTIHIYDVFFWTDSMTVLQYIANERTRFHTFVANIVNIIREGSIIQQW